MTRLQRQITLYPLVLSLGISLMACAGDPMESGVDPFAPMVFKEGKTTLPINPPNKDTLVPFYVSNTTMFKFAIDTSSIAIGADGITRYTVVMTSPNGNQQIQFEGIRCDSMQWRLYGNYDGNKWQSNPLSTWNGIKDHAPNRYQAALAQGAFCNLNMQETNLKDIIKSLNPNGFTGGMKPSNSLGIVE
jgi:CNP1-like family